MTTQKKSPSVGRLTGTEVFGFSQRPKTSSPGSTRTNDPLINSQLLYRLSYWGKINFSVGFKNGRPSSRTTSMLQEKISLKRQFLKNPWIFQTRSPPVPSPLSPLLRPSSARRDLRTESIWQLSRQACPVAALRYGAGRLRSSMLTARSARTNQSSPVSVCVG